MGKTEQVVTKALKDMEGELADFLRRANGVVAAKRKEVASFESEATAADKQFHAANQKVIGEINKAYAGMKDDIASLVKSYMAIVRDTDGLTSVRPGVAKALDRYSMTLDSKHLDEAVAVLEKHKGEVVKQVDKKDKTAIAFSKAMDELISNLG